METQTQQLHWVSAEGCLVEATFKGEGTGTGPWGDFETSRNGQSQASGSGIAE